MCLSGQAVNLWKDRRVWSLLDVIRYAVKNLHALLLWIDHMVNFTYSQENVRYWDAALLTAQEKQTVAGQIACVRKHFQTLELEDAFGICDEFKIKLDYQNLNLGECRGYLLSLRRILTDTLEKRVFMYVPAGVSKYARGYQGPATQAPQSFFALTTMIMDSHSLAAQPFGSKVFNTFESARFDSEQVALCLVAGASTAAVFHMMRVVEWGVRALGKDLGLRKIKDVMKPKPGGSLKTPKIKLTPIENATWEKIRDQLRGKVDKRLSKLRPGPAKDRKSAYYGSLLEDFNGFKDAWRNHVMHSRFECKNGDELRVMAHVDRFMKSLAEGCPVTAPSA